MAFVTEQLSHIGGASLSVRMYAYFSGDDDKFDVLSANYFDPAFLKLRPLDLMFVTGAENVYTCKVISVSQDSVVVEKTSLLSREYAYYHVDAEQSLDIPDDGVTYVQVPDMVLSEENEFSLDGNNLVYNGIGGRFLFNGTTNLRANKVSDIQISLSVNDTFGRPGVLISFPNSNKSQSSASTVIFSLVTGDVIKVEIRGDGTTGITADIRTLNITLLEM